MVHDNAPVIAIDILASPHASSLPMTFSGDFSSVTFEMTLQDSPSVGGRQYYQMIGAEATDTSVPVLPLPALIALYSGIAATGGLYIRKRVTKA